MKLLNSFFSITGRDLGGEKQTFGLELNPSHPIFAAHFPGNPIVPGVCQIQMVTEVLEEHLCRRLYVKEIKNIKYISILSPNEVTRLNLTIQKLVEDPETLRATVVFETESKAEGLGTAKVFSKISLTYVYDVV